MVSVYVEIRSNKIKCLTIFPYFRTIQASRPIWVFINKKFQEDEAVRS